MFGKRNAASPSEPALLTTPTEGFPPEAKHPVPEQTKAVQVPRYRVVVEVALQNGPEPSSGLRHWIVHTLTKLLFDFLQLLPHAFADRHASHRVVPFAVLPADMREAKKVEGLRFAFPSSFPVLFGIPPELDQARLVWMKFQSKLPQPCPEILQKPIRVCLILET